MKAYNLNRFIEAQNKVYINILEELRNGHKETHWIWYIFPQLKGLGRSSTANYYGIKNIEEAKCYFAHNILGQRLLECSKILFKLDNNDISSILGSPDDLKLKSSMTLFYKASGKKIFLDILIKYFYGKYDISTLNLLKMNHIRF